MSRQFWRLWKRTWALCCGKTACGLLAGPRTVGRASARTSIPASAGILAQGGIHFRCAILNPPAGPRKRRAFVGMADEDVKSILETLEKDLGAVLR